MFCCFATLVKKLCYDVSGKIFFTTAMLQQYIFLLQLFFCVATLVLLRSTVSGESPFIFSQTVFCFNEVKVGLFLLQ